MAMISRVLFSLGVVNRNLDLLLTQAVNKMLEEQINSFRKCTLNYLLNVKETTQEWGICTLDSVFQFDLWIQRKINIPDLEISHLFCDFSFTLKVKCPDSLKLPLKQSS